MIKWLKKRREKRNKEVAKAVYEELSASRGWEKFLNPAVLEGTIYMVTENGSIYRMNKDRDGYEIMSFCYIPRRNKFKK